MVDSENELIADALVDGLQSDRCSDRGDSINVVDAIDRLADSAQKVARAILPMSYDGGIVLPGNDAIGGTVDSLTEAVMGMTGGLVRIAEAIDRLASAVEDK